MNKIISFVMVGTNDLEKSSKFYDAIFVHLGLKKVSTAERMISYAFKWSSWSQVLYNKTL